MKPPDTCPFCGAGIKYPPRLRNQYRGDTYMTSAQYLCGSSASEHWSPPLDYCAHTRVPMPDTIQPFKDKAARNGLSLSQQHRSDMLYLCAAIYGINSPTYRKFLAHHDSVPPLPDKWKP